MESTHTKPCQACFSPIQEVAKICPFCNTLRPHQANTTRNTMLWTVLSFLLYGVFLFFIFKLTQNTGLSNNHWGEHAQKVQVTSSVMRFEVKEKSHIVALSGTIRNDSDFAWSRPIIEVQYFNRAGKLIDTETVADHKISLPAHSEQAFKVECAAIHPNAEYVSHKVRINNAQDAKRYERPHLF